MSVCVCGHDHTQDAKGDLMSEGRGHSRSMGRATFAAAGGFTFKGESDDDDLTLDTAGMSDEDEGQYSDDEY